MTLGLSFRFTFAILFAHRLSSIYLFVSFTLVIVYFWLFDTIIATGFYHCSWRRRNFGKEGVYATITTTILDFGINIPLTKGKPIAQNGDDEPIR